MVEVIKIVEQNPWWRFGMDFVQYDKTLKEYEEASVKMGNIWGSS